MIEFGFMVSEDTMMSMYSSGHQAIEFAIDLKKKSIDINFHVKAISMQSVLDLGYYRLQLKLDKMRLAYFEVCEDSEIMVIPLEAPPELYRKTSQISNTHQTDFGFWSDWDALIRQTDVVVNEQQLRAQPTSLRRESAIIDIGKCSAVLNVKVQALILSRPMDHVPHSLSEDPRLVRITHKHATDSGELQCASTSARRCG